MAALFIAAALFLTAWELGRDAVMRMIDPPEPVVNQWTIIALVASAVIQGLTGWWEWREALRLRSEVLLADARHTLTSIWISAAVLIGLGLVWLGYPWADPLVALLVAVLIGKIGVDTVRENVPALVDRAPLEAALIAEVVAGVEGVQSFHRIRSRGPADNVAVDLHIRISPQLSVPEANAIADEVRRRLLALPGVDDVTVHSEAQREADDATGLYAATRLAAQTIGVTIHEWWVQELDQQLTLHLHVGVDPNLTIAGAHELVLQLEKTLRERLPQIMEVHCHLEPANSIILPSARVSTGLQQRISFVVEQVVETIPHLSHPHNIQVRQVEGRLFITLSVLVNNTLSAGEAYQLSTRLQESIRIHLPDVGETLVRLEPTAGSYSHTLHEVTLSKPQKVVLHSNS